MPTYGKPKRSAGLSIKEVMKDLKPGSYLAGDNSEYFQASERSSLNLLQVLRPNLDADPDLVLDTQARRDRNGSVMDKSDYQNSTNNSLGEDRSVKKPNSPHSHIKENRELLGRVNPSRFASHKKLRTTLGQLGHQIIQVNYFACQDVHESHDKSPEENQN